MVSKPEQWVKDFAKVQKFLVTRKAEGEETDLRPSGSVAGWCEYILFPLGSCERTKNID